jgi:hypothetical protein
MSVSISSVRDFGIDSVLRVTILVADDGGENAVPQLKQKFESSGCCTPQLKQNIAHSP